MIFLNEQKTITLDLNSKGIRLDVYIADDENSIFAVEMQKSDRHNLPKRTRYYQGNIDLDLLEKGEDYNLLLKSYVIFICTHDPFSQGRHRYTFENVCLENPEIRLEDDTQKIILSSKGVINDVDEEMKAFLRYVEHSTAEIAAKTDSELLKQVHRRVESVKTDKRMEVEFMTLLERDRINREEGRSEGLVAGRSEGIEQKALEAALNLKAKGVSDEIIAEAIGLPIERVRAL